MQTPRKPPSRAAAAEGSSESVLDLSWRSRDPARPASQPPRGRACQALKERLAEATIRGSPP